MSIRSRRVFTLFAASIIPTLASCSTQERNVADNSQIGSANIRQESPIQNVAHQKRGKFIKTRSGLQYRIIRQTDGLKPGAYDSVRAHYRGWLDNGKEFDSSYKRGEPSTFPLYGVVKGWTEGLQLIGEGGKIELIIPAELGYGENGRPGIPGGATLNFEVELIEVL